MRMIVLAHPVGEVCISLCILYSDGKYTFVEYNSDGSVSMEDCKFSDYDDLFKVANSALLELL